MTNDPPDRVPEALGDFIAAVVALVTGPAGPLIGAVARGPLVELAQRSYNEIRGRQALNAGALLGGAASELGVDPEELVASALHGGDVSSQLLYESIRAATNTLHTEKIAWLARAFANGLRDDNARVDVMILATRALGDLDPVHAKVLDLLCREHGPVREIDLRTVCGASGFEAINAVLVRHGMVDNATDFVGIMDRSMLDASRMSGLDGIPRRTARPSTTQIESSSAWEATSFGRTCWEQIAPADGHQELAAPLTPAEE